MMASPLFPFRDAEVSALVLVIGNSNNHTYARSKIVQLCLYPMEKDLYTFEKTIYLH